jgi:hypothetical protein
VALPVGDDRYDAGASRFDLPLLAEIHHDRYRINGIEVT